MKAFVNAKLVFPDRVQEGTVLVENGKILASGDVIPPAEAEIIDVQGAYIGPGLVDIHSHGYVGDASEPCYSVYEYPYEMSRAHLRKGTTTLTPSCSYSQTVERFMKGIRNCKSAMEKEDCTIVGIHFEGPFTNPNYGSNKDRTWKYSRELCDMIFDEADGAVVHCTYAPEMPHGEEMEQILKERGVIADIGHTEVGPEDAARAVKNGARIVTHLYDAMGCWRGKDVPRKSYGVRADSADMVLLAIPGLYYELICDSRGVHVKPENARMAFRAAGEDAIILVTDCADLRDYDPADYPLENKRSAPDLYFNDAGELSASCLDMTSACRNFMRFTGADVRTAFKCASTNPAKAINMDDKFGSILPGRDANLLIVDEDFHLQDVYFRGKKVE